MRTRSYRAARHQQRASLMSAAQSTSTPSFGMVSERRSRFMRELSTNKTRFFLTAAIAGSGLRKMPEERFILPPHSSRIRLLLFPLYAELRAPGVVPDSERGAQLRLCASCEILPCHR